MIEGCSSARFVPQGETVLSSVKIKSDTKHVRPADYRAYVRQNANARWFNLVKVPLGIYCLSGRDSTRSFNRFLRRLGEAPVIYSERETELSRQALMQAMQGKGYLHATASFDTVHRSRSRTDLVYRLHPGTRSYVRNIRYFFDNDTIALLVRSDSAASLLRRGMPLDASRLAAERSRLVNYLRGLGYYHFHKEFISFRADTLADDYGIDLTLEVKCPPGVRPEQGYTAFTLDSVRVYEDVTPDVSTDTTSYHGLRIHYADRLHILRRVYRSHTYLRPGQLYNEVDMQNTYRALNALPPVSYTSVRFTPVDSFSPRLNCDIFVKRNQPHTISAEVEGTNTSGDLGAALAFTYTNRNLFRGAESFSVKLRGAYEAITGLEGYNNQNYIEYSAETSLRFPTLLFPFISNETKQGLKAALEVSLMYNSQDRPEFHRRTLTGSWSYRWNRNGDQRLRHRLDLFSLNYVFMPCISDTFREDYLEGDDPRYAVLRYSYENLFIMKLGYSLTLTSSPSIGNAGLDGTDGYRLRFAVETAGNLLYGASKLFHARRNAAGQYSLFDIAYSQYAKVDLDFVGNVAINSRNSMAFHAALGVAVPYGNSTIVPYEKRYFSGGANSIRGWGVRELGPGSFVGTDGKIDFINHTGNLRLDLSMEYRTHLFWKLHGAAFIDAGNIWNLRDYADQPGGYFRFKTFLEQIAVSYGLGLRFNLDYFVLRFDAGMKAINPTIPTGSGHYPIFHPRFSRDFAFHFAVGLPF